MRVCDYIADFVYNLGVKHVFMVSGGGMMYLSDGLTKHPSLYTVCTHHEQAAAMAAVSYAKYTRNLGVCYVTTGCGGTNTITGVLNAWQDNVPCLFISGQDNVSRTVRNSKLPLRQFGVQEADIVSIVQPITKYSVMVTDPYEIKYHLQKAVYLAQHGRPAPVWIDVPLDVQRAEIEEDGLSSFSLSSYEPNKTSPIGNEVDLVADLINKAQRPIIIAGQGVRISNAIDQFKYFIGAYNIPYVASRLGIDLLPSNHPLFIGRIGNKGDRAGNFAVQNADLVLVLGSRLSVSSTGFNYSLFAREATIIVVDIDPYEHQKNTVTVDFFIQSDVGKFLSKLSRLSLCSVWDKWSYQCSKWKEQWKVCLPEYRQTEKINTYVFVDTLSKYLKEDSVVVSDAGSAFYVVSQGIMLKDKQRYITSGGQAEMGYTLPASVGVCFSRDKREVVGITGDGSFQMNIQELQTIVHYKLPIKLFVWNNNGYSSIKETQDKFFNGRRIGTDPSTGVSFPSIKKIAKAYGIKYVCIDGYDDMDEKILKILKSKTAVLCEVICDDTQKVSPCSASKVNADGTIQALPLEDMYPFLDRQEFNENMIIKPI